MKYLICSDLHGSAAAGERLIQRFNEHKCDLMILLGDLLNFGPRNPFPERYSPPQVAELLNGNKDKIIAVRGNCDSEVDQMMFEFPMMADYALIVDEGKRIFATHGHLYNPQNMPLGKTDFFLYGHTHVRHLEKVGETLICNPGSVSMPKDALAPSYAIYEKGEIKVFDL
jgi:putative phosphoesterase